MLLRFITYTVGGASFAVSLFRWDIGQFLDKAGTELKFKTLAYHTNGKYVWPKNVREERLTVDQVICGPIPLAQNEFPALFLTQFISALKIILHTKTGLRCNQLI